MAPAAADTMISPAIFGGLGQKTLACYLFNGGPTNVTVTSFRIYTLSGVVSSTGVKCLQTIGYPAGCEVNVPVSNNSAYACIIQLSSKANVRGSLEMRDGNGNVLNRADLR